jgi:hypothetical protein
METFTPKYRRDPNAKVESLYFGVSNGGQAMTSMVTRAVNSDGMEATRSYEPTTLQRGESGQAGIFIIGGMETTLDEMEYLMEIQKARQFVPRKTGGEIANMCRDLMERRNDTIRYYRKNPSEVPKLQPKKTARLYLPAGMRWANTNEPGLKIAVGV